MPGGRKASIITLYLVLEERGFNVSKFKVNCSPVCPFESENCCLARLLSQQEDFTNQPSMLETLIKGAGHECIFLPKFHCELNPIEMVSNHLFFHLLKLSLTNSAQADHFIQYWGWCKYRYREHPKANFAAAKGRVLQVLDVCPVTVEVIRRFINRLWKPIGPVS